jgi:hypothetical protein
LLMGFLGEQLADVGVRPLAGISKSADFMPFAETTQEHFALLKDFPTHIHLFRKAPTYWDAAFQLYSGLIAAQTAQQLMKK